MAEKDKPEIQRVRLRKLLQEIQPAYSIVFDDQCRGDLKFRIDDQKGNPLGVYQRHSSVIADMSDDKIKGIMLAVIQKNENAER